LADPAQLLRQKGHGQQRQTMTNYY